MNTLEAAIRSVLKKKVIAISQNSQENACARDSFLIKLQVSGIMYKRDLIRKNCYTQTIAIHILTDIWKSKGNQTMKFSQLIEYNIRIVFLEKSLSKCGGESIPRSLDQ